MIGRTVSLCSPVASILALACLACGLSQPRHEEPVAPSAQPADSGPVFAEGFDGQLGEGWIWLGEVEDRWNLTAGTLELTVPASGIFGLEDRAPENLLLRELPLAVTCAEVLLEAAPEALYENAGLIVFSGVDDYAVVTLEALPGQHEPPLVVRVFAEASGTLTDDSIRAAPAVTRLWLRARLSGDRVVGSYRLPDDVEWTVIGESRLSEARPRRVGLQAGYGGQGSSNVASFHAFRLLEECGE